MSDPMTALLLAALLVGWVALARYSLDAALLLPGPLLVLGMLIYAALGGAA